MGKDATQLSLLTESNEDIFLAELLKGKTEWTKIAMQLESAGKACAKEKEYAEAYRVLLHKFTEIEKD
jgi:hypothetical protein